MKRFWFNFSVTLVLLLALSPLAFAVSANVTLGTGGREFEADSTQRTATLAVRGGTIYNKSSGSVWVDLDAGTVVTSNGSTSIEIAQGTSIKVPASSGSFTFKTASGSSYILYVGP